MFRELLIFLFYNFCGILFWFWFAQAFSVRYFSAEDKSLPAHCHGELGHWWL